MPKLNKIRLTRIRYNNNLTGIDDAIIDMDGVSTLLKLANGGGKTVLIQMLLAPYVSGRRRNFKDRPFSDYFKDPIPSFIVEEWIKDNRTGKFLVGLMVRKSQYTSENNGSIRNPFCHFLLQKNTWKRYPGHIPIPFGSTTWQPMHPKRNSGKN